MLSLFLTIYKCLMKLGEGLSVFFPFVLALARGVLVRDDERS
jgi:hypothetical protein